MDPISVSASILGLLGAAAKVSEVLTNFVGSVKDAPRLAQRVVTEVEDLTVCLQRLHEFVASQNPSRRSRRALIMVDQLRVVLSHCVITFSELERAVEGLKPRASVSIGNRLRWVAKESIISKLLQRLQFSKSSLNLILTTLTCTDVEEAQQSIDALTGLVHDVLASNGEICRRLEQSNLSTEVKHQSAPSALESHDRRDNVSVSRADRGTWSSEATTAAERAADRDVSFEQDLHRSRVYTRSDRTLGRRSEPDLFSLPSSTARSIGSSFFSGLSLADISNISLVSLPVSGQSLFNGQRYRELRVLDQAPKCLPTGFGAIPRSSGKVLLLGISNAGKSTILKQLQIQQGIGPTQIELDEARNVLRMGLIGTFRRALLDYMQHQPGDEQEKALELLCQFTQPPHIYHAKVPVEEFSNREVDFERALETCCRSWEQEDIKATIDAVSWPHKLNNISHIMDNLVDIFWEEASDSYLACLAYLHAHITTSGVYRSRLPVDPFDFEICDVGGTRAERKKWYHYVQEKLDYIIYVADLNSYCQCLAEDHDANQMTESLQVFESIVNKPLMQDVPVFLLLNKADLFEHTILSKPISDYFSDYSGGGDYFRACGFFADRFARLDRRSPGKLHCYVTNSLDTFEFKNAWEHVREKMLHITLKI